mgnify:CR=1 FL=1
MMQGGPVPGARQQRATHVGDRQCSTLYEEVCELKRREAALISENERLQQVIQNMSERIEALTRVRECWRRERHVGKECANGEAENTTG